MGVLQKYESGQLADTIGITAEQEALIAGIMPVGSDAWLKANCDLDLIIVGTITHDANGAATLAPVKWRNGAAGVYTATVLSPAFPGAVDAYTVTYLGTTTKTVTQPTVTRDASGAVITRPELTVA